MLNGGAGAIDILPDGGATADSANEIGVCVSGGRSILSNFNNVPLIVTGRETSST